MNKTLAQKKITEASDVLQQIGLPEKQQKERSALTLLALLNLKPNDSWSESKRPMLGITPMMGFFELYYKKKYAPNSRESVRRLTVHQFLQAAIIIKNPDNPDRPTNSGKTVYQISEFALQLFSSYGTPSWHKRLKIYLETYQSLQTQYDGSRKTTKIPLTMPFGDTIHLSPGDHNVLVRKICNEFVRIFVPRGVPLYVGDTAKKFAYSNNKMLKTLGISLQQHGKIPDVIIHDTVRNWIFLIEAVTSHGPIDAKRKKELQNIFSRSKTSLVYVTAFADKKTMKKYIGDISWETEVWTADSPDHMIHFDGTRFLGPYD